jgi:hypothetical protein
VQVALHPALAEQRMYCSKSCEPRDFGPPESVTRAAQLFLPHVSTLRQPLSSAQALIITQPPSSMQREYSNAQRSHAQGLSQLTVTPFVLSRHAGVMLTVR